MNHLCLIVLWDYPNGVACFYTNRSRGDGQRRE